MQLWQRLFKQYRLKLLLLVMASLISAVVSIGVIAFINDALIGMSDNPWVVFAQFIGLLAFLLVIRLLSQWSLTYIGHTFVYDFRNTFVKRIIDTDIDVIENIGNARLLASLSKDIDRIKIAFMRLPDIVQGGILIVAAIAYLGYLSPDILLVVLVWIVVVAVVGSLLVRRVYHYYKQVRHTEDALYQDFESVIYGRKELALNRKRAKRLYTDEYNQHALDIRKQIIFGDAYHFAALNWSNVMMLGSIGLVFFLANVLGWADNRTASIYALTLLFLQTPIVQAVGALPTLLDAQVSFKKMDALQLAEAHDTFDVFDVTADWQHIRLENVAYQYKHAPVLEDTTQDNDNRERPTDSGTPINTDKESHIDTIADGQAKTHFGIGPINFTLNRGEIVFLIGGNGSGKSTFAKLLTGIYQADGGHIFVDDTAVTANNIRQYRQRFSAIFTDLFLFKTLVGKDTEITDAEQQMTREWLNHLHMTEKIHIENDRVANQELSQGQRKRLAMLLAVLEQKELLMLDEWAADQDPQFRRVFYHELLPMLKAMGKTLLVISHDDHYFEQADRLIQMKNGKLTELTGQARRDASRDAVASIS